MIIGIDGNEANISNRVGVGQFAFQVLKHLHSIDNTNQYIIYLKDKPLSDLPPEKSNWQYCFFGPKKLWTKIALPFHLLFQKNKLDVFFSPSHYSPMFCPCPTVPTIHDLGYLKFPAQFTQKDLFQLTNWTKSSIFKASHIATVSEFTKNEIHHIYHIPKSKISVCYNGTDSAPHFDPQTSEKVLSNFNIKANDYLLYLGTLKPSKNIPFLISAFAQSIKEQDNIMLVIAGKNGWLYNEIFEQIENLNIKDKIIFTDYIDESTKWVLYKNAKALVIPSLYEGFGIPAIEAQQTKTKIFASDIPSLREILGSSAYYFNPHNQSELTNLIQNIDNLPELKVPTNKFTWDKTAKSILKILSQV